MKSFIEILNGTEEINQSNANKNMVDLFLSESIATKTVRNNDHYHKIDVDLNGDGVTTSTIGAEEHQHTIYSWVVQPMMKHTHAIEGLVEETSLVEAVEGKANLQLIFNFLNNKYFNKSIPKIKVKWSKKLKASIGIANAVLNDDGTLKKSSLAITISSVFSMDLRALQEIMLHEMVHIKLYTMGEYGDHHNLPMFKSEIDRIRNQSTLKVPYLETTLKPSDIIKPKSGYMMIFYLSGNRYGFVCYTKKVIDEKMEELTKKLNYNIKYNIELDKAELYLVSNSLVSVYTANRSIKLSFYKMEEIEKDNIVKTGKLLNTFKG